MEAPVHAVELAHALRDGACRARVGQSSKDSCATAGSCLQASKQAHLDWRYEETAHHLKRACDLDSAIACNRLGRWHETGETELTKDLKRSAALYRKACEGGDMSGCVDLGVNQQDGRGVPPKAP